VPQKGLQPSTEYRLHQQWLYREFYAYVFTTKLRPQQLLYEAKSITDAETIRPDQPSPIYIQMLTQRSSEWLISSSCLSCAYL